MQMKKIEEKAKFYKALGEPIRLKIIEYLLNKKECVCICDFSKLLKRDQSVIFRHVQILKDAGILSTNKEAKFLMCCLKNEEMIRRLLSTIEIMKQKGKKKLTCNIVGRGLCV